MTNQTTVCSGWNPVPPVEVKCRFATMSKEREATAGKSGIAVATHQCAQNAIRKLEAGSQAAKRIAHSASVPQAQEVLRA